MDEPMEEAEADTTQPDLVPEVPKRQPNPLLRPGSMVMMTITVEDYESQYWPKLEQAIDQLLTMQPGQYIPISYEQMYSCVYKCVCKQFSERLYADLMKHMKSHLFALDKELEQSMQTPASFIHKFSFLMNQYLQALGGIVPIFNYMNRFYVETKLKTDLSHELRNLFRTVVVDKHASTILSLLEDANSKPFTVSPPTMAMLIKNLHLLNPDYAKIKPALFSKYIPNVLPATSLLELDRYAEETKQMQLEIHKHPGFESNDRSRKRRIEEEGPIK
ncbi:hypothetical protein CHS0354_037745 [Potamilus streckersoni]|uniref:Cullin N-terminal domain-containing protein n=1 Tax=Potamilus streckersoni TaxID=2493646 RepID=A0AAE0W5Q2_9BIVA|nr:hypothetical protein CHS0354_037745 [Potamilus streckersoni]